MNVKRIYRDHFKDGVKEQNHKIVYRNLIILKLYI